MATEKKPPYVTGMTDNSGGHRSWNRSPKAKVKGVSSMSKQVISKNRKKI